MFPVVTAPWMAGSAFPSRSLNKRAAIISAMHCPMPAFMFSFLASTTITAGASMVSCSGERLNRKWICASCAENPIVKPNNSGVS